MTNTEYFEKNNIRFSHSMKLFYFHIYSLSDQNMKLSGMSLT